MEIAEKNAWELRQATKDATDDSQDMVNKGTIINTKWTHERVSSDRQIK